MTRCSRASCRWRRLFFFFFQVFPFTLSALPSATRPSRQLVASKRALGHLFAACLGTQKLPKPVQLYSQGAWFVTPDLASHIRQQGNDDDGTAQVWQLNGKPRAVYQWTHDGEFDRNTLACLNENGIVARQINEYMPGLSEPELHYIFIHTFTLAAGGQYRSSSRFTNWNGQPIPAPRLTSEDRDFIAGERRYTKWNDFDLAGALQRAQ